MNKLAIALANGIVEVGVLIVPSRALYEHLTDRIGNIGELSGYLSMWVGLKATVDRGVLAITVVEQDALTDDDAFPYLPRGSDGRAKEGRAKMTVLQSFDQSFGLFVCQGLAVTVGGRIAPHPTLCR